MICPMLDKKKLQEHCALNEEKLDGTGAQFKGSPTKSLCLSTLQSGVSHAQDHLATKLQTLQSYKGTNHTQTLASSLGSKKSVQQVASRSGT